MLINQYDYCLESMFKLKRFGIKLELSTMKNLLNKLGNPQNNFKSIHVAGSNGKGSVASALSTILQKAGYKVGLYTSPHLIRYNERIRINGVPISNKDVVNSWGKIKSIILKEREATFFEFSTAMAFYEFGSKNVDLAVIETGMGGRLDATNVISPILSIITNISLEHREYLGNTIKQISIEKSGIIKPKVPIVSGVTQKSARAIIQSVAKKMNSELLLKGKDFRTRKNYSGSFLYSGKYNQWNNMCTSLMGNHQIENAAVTLAACESLIKKHICLSLTHIRSGLLDNQWEGRLEVALKSPYVILDGAHNLAAAKNLGYFLKSNLTNKNITLVVGILDDKPYKKMLKVLTQHCSRVIATQANNTRALSVEKIRKAAKFFKQDVDAIADVGEALSYAISTSTPDDTICVAGSLYVVGEAKILLKKHYNLSK